MTPEQCRAARAWLNWGQRDLAAKARVSSSTIRDFEAGRRVPHANNLMAIRRALEAAGMRIAEDGRSVGLAGARREESPEKAVQSKKRVRGRRG